MHGISPQTLKKIPKIDLHVHIDGAVETSTILDLAREQEADLPAKSVEELEKHVTAGPDCRSLGDFLEVFEVFYPLLKSPKALERISYELCRREAEDNVAYFEARFAPVLQSGTRGGIPDVVKAALRGIERGCSKFGVKAGLILCCYRSEPPQTSVETAKTAVEFMGKGVVGLDLAGDEQNYRALDHLEAFLLAREAGLPVTAHAGEVSGPGNIQEALFLLGARRLGHAVSLFEDPELLGFVVQNRIAVETCLTSNRQTGAWPDLETHPFGVMLEAGAAVTINTDDPAVSRTTLSGELALAARLFKLDLGGIEALLLNSVEAAFAPEGLKDELRKKIERGIHEAG
jgi:adenosine deaminase